MLETSIPQNCQPCPAFDPLADQQPVKIMDAGHGVMVEPDNHVPGAHTGFLRRRTLHNFVDAHAGSLRQLMPAGQRFIDRSILAGLLNRRQQEVIDSAPSISPRSRSGQRAGS